MKTIGELLGEFGRYPYTPEQERRMQARIDAEAKAKLEEDDAHLASMAEKALAGVYGARAKVKAREILLEGGRQRTDRRSLEYLRSQITTDKIPERKSG